VSYTIAFQEFGIPLWGFSLLFFLLVLYFSLKPGRILDWIGRFLNPLFLLFFSILILLSLIHPMASQLGFSPVDGYESGAFFKGFLEGYNTMDAIAGLIFGIVVVDTVRNLGIKDSDRIAAFSMKSGLFCAFMMALIYAGATYIGTTSLGVFPLSSNGGIALGEVCRHYFGSFGGIFLGAIVLFACLKTAIGLVTTIASAFNDMFTGGKHYQAWAVLLTVFSFSVSNVGLDLLIQLSLPVLMFLYPLSITMIALGLGDGLFQGSREVYVSVTVFTLVAAFFDMLHAFGFTLFDGLASKVLPLYHLGFGWVVPSLLGLLVGLSLKRVRRESRTSDEA
ncbi:MAG: branched-chain amino acid transport system II carrier protein, partial [Spirochaetales bacterium]|nr:branched-chain amino acid transport system II carrier protein [Candidatus Physcosoma equi]